MYIWISGGSWRELELDKWRETELHRIAVQCSAMHYGSILGFGGTLSRLS
jgi:hypothetical protein